jgi:hypothetical protein
MKKYYGHIKHNGHYRRTIINIAPDQKLILFRNYNTGISILFDAKAM